MRILLCSRRWWWRISCICCLCRRHGLCSKGQLCGMDPLKWIQQTNYRPGWRIVIRASPRGRFHVRSRDLGISTSFISIRWIFGCMCCRLCSGCRIDDPRCFMIFMLWAWIIGFVWIWGYCRYWKYSLYYQYSSQQAHSSVTLYF